MPYALLDIELGCALEPVRLQPNEAGVGLVSRSAGRVVGFALHAAEPGSCLSPATLASLLDPTPVDPPAPPAPGDGAPSITVVVCTKDRPELLNTCLAALLECGVPRDVILVVDNAPADGSTRGVVERLGVEYVLEPCPGLDFARNRALVTARSDVVAFVDDDVVVDRHWFDSLRAVWAQHADAGAVTGQILPLELATDAQIAFERRGGFRGGNEQVRYQGLDRDDNPVYPYGAGMFGAGANMSVRRNVALRIGGFDEALDTGPPLPGGGDIDLLHRVIRAGTALVYEPRTVVFHRHRRDARGLRRQYDSWGRSLMAYAVKTYRQDPEGRPKLRLLVRWFFATHVRGALSGTTKGDTEARDAAVAELGGAVAGLLGEYGRSQRRVGRRRREHARPTVALLPWGNVVEDYTEPIGLSLDDYAERLSGGWLFGFVAAFAGAGVDSVILCWSRNVTRPVRRIHLPTGSPLWILPAPLAYRAASSVLADPYAWARSRALREDDSRPAWVGALARAAAPYLATSPRGLTRVLRQEGCRAVVCQEYEEGRFDVCVALGRLLRLPVFATFQGGDHTRTKIERWLRPWTVRAAAGLIIGAEREVARVRERYGVPPERIAQIPNPLDVSTVRVHSRGEARAALGVSPDRRVAVWHGRVDIIPKGIDTLIEAWSQVRVGCATPPLLLLLGTGTGADWLHDRIEALGLDDVIWRDEYVLDRDIVGTFLSAADVFVLPSRQEGFPVAPVEAMAAGLPVVATDAPGVRAVVGEGEDAGGVVVEREDARALASALRRFLDDPALSEAVGERAARRVAERFSLDAVGTQLRRFVVDGIAAGGEP